MTGKTYIEDIATMLSSVDQQLERARKTIEQADLPKKAAAIAELVKLEARRSELADRFEKAKEKHADEWSDLRKGLQEDLDSLKDTLERWILQYS